MQFSITSDFLSNFQNAAVNAGVLEIGQSLLDRNEQELYPGNDMWSKLIKEIRGTKSSDIVSKHDSY